MIFYLNNNFLNILYKYFSVFFSLLYLFLKYLLLYAILYQLIYLERIIFYANIICYDLHNFELIITIESSRRKSIYFWKKYISMFRKYCS